MPPFRSFLGTPSWEETLGQILKSLGGLYISHLAFEHCGISQVELEKAEEKDIGNTKLSLLWLGDAERMKGGILNFKWQLWASL